MTATLDAAVVTEPGVYDLDDVTYHADPVPGGSLSCSGAKKLLPPSCPALYRYERDHPPAPKKVFDFGHAAHQMVLGVGPELVEVEHDDWRTNAAKEKGAEARERGAVPLLTKELDVVKAMAEALHRHPIARALLGDGGKAEASLFWPDEATGVMRRCRLDWHPQPKSTRLIGVDYKTAASADPEKFARAAMDYGYHQQARWYLDGLQALDLAGDDAQFVFIAQEKSAPYLVSVVQLDVVALRIGHLLNRRAVELYAQCVETDHWPGYSEGEVAHMSFPTYYEKEFEDQL